MRSVIREEENATIDQHNHLYDLLHVYGWGIDHVLSRMREDSGVNIEFDPIRGLSKKQVSEAITYLRVYNSTFRGTSHNVEPLEPYRPSRTG